MTDCGWSIAAAGPTSTRPSRHTSALLDLLHRETEVMWPGERDVERAVGLVGGVETSPERGRVGLLQPHPDPVPLPPLRLVAGHAGDQPLAGVLQPRPQIREGGPGVRLWTSDGSTGVMVTIVAAKAVQIPARLPWPARRSRALRRCGRSSARVSRAGPRQDAALTVLCSTERADATWGVTKRPIRMVRKGRPHEDRR